MAVLWTSSSCFFPSRFPSLLRVAFFVLPSTVHTDCMPCCPYVVCRIVVILRISWYWAYWWYCRMDLTWYWNLAPCFVMFETGLAGTVERVSRSRLSTSSRPLLPCTFLLSATESTCSSMAWGSTVFGVAWLVNSFEARKVVLWLLETCQQSRTGWCRVVSTRLKPRGLAKPPRMSPLHVSSLGFFPAHIKGRSGLGFQRNLELAFSNLSAPAEL